VVPKRRRHVVKPQQLTIQKAIKKAKKAIKQGNISAAQQLYNAVLQQQPNHPIAKKGLRKLVKNFPRKQSVQTQITNPSPDQINDLTNLYYSGQFTKAEQVCKELLQTFAQSLFVINVLGAAFKGQGKLQEAAQAFDKAIQLKPDYAAAYSNRGVVLTDLGQLKEAVDSYNKAIQLKPDYAEAYSNRGNALRDLGQLEEAVRSCDKAIRLKPDYAEAYSNRGVALGDLGQLKEAVDSYNKAIQLKPDYANAYCNRGNALKELGQLGVAITSYQKALTIDPQSVLFWNGFADILQIVRYTSYSNDLSYYLLGVLEQPTVCPKNVSKAMISALHYHPIVSHTLELSKYYHIDEDIDHLTEQLATVSLLLRVMELSPIADLDVEKMLTKMRRAMLHKATSGEGKAQSLPFYAALAMHCFTNEYVFYESEEEKQKIELLDEKVKVALKKGDAVSPDWVAVLASYRPLYNFSWTDSLLEFEWSEAIKKVIVGQVDNIRKEQALRSKIPRLTSIEDKVSQLVRNQYEENPYPRWVTAGLSDKPRTIRQVLQSIKLYLNYGTQQFSNKPDILVAGCGTGKHALSTASRFLNCNVLALDLSLSSLSYAIRKTEELGVTNIEYMQGDILKLDQLEREFDIIESVGVLHHMDNPLAGWKVLVDKLRSGGLMKIGLYSDIARQHIAAVRREIAEKKYTSSPDDIRRYREEIINMDLNSESEVMKVTEFTDFYSLSECRDLLFHVQEHRFSLPQIEEALRALGLKFLGFELAQGSIIKRFKERYKEKSAPTCLTKWHEFELKNPDIFEGMYQFWVQKL